MFSSALTLSIKNLHKRLSLMPPDEAFAQIINTEDYILYQNKRENEEKRRKERNVKSRYID